MVHEGGVTLHKTHNGEWYFRTMHGKVVTAPVREEEKDDEEDEETENAPRGAFATPEFEAWLKEMERRDDIREPVPIYAA